MTSSLQFMAHTTCCYKRKRCELFKIRQLKIEKQFFSRFIYSYSNFLLGKYKLINLNANLFRADFLIHNVPPTTTFSIVRTNRRLTSLFEINHKLKGNLRVSQYILGQQTYTFLSSSKTTRIKTVCKQKIKVFIMMLKLEQSQES